MQAPPPALAECEAHLLLQLGFRFQNVLQLDAYASQLHAQRSAGRVFLVGDETRAVARCWALVLAACRLRHQRSASLLRQLFGIRCFLLRLCQQQPSFRNRKLLQKCLRGHGSNCSSDEVLGYIGVIAPADRKATGLLHSRTSGLASHNPDHLDNRSATAVAAASVHGSIAVTRIASLVNICREHCGMLVSLRDTSSRFSQGISSVKSQWQLTDRLVDLHPASTGYTPII
jgi:hypothetical protein